MVHRVRRVGVEQLAKLLGAIYLFFGVILAVLFAGLGALVPGTTAEEGWSMFRGGFLLVMPVMYGVIGLVSGALVAWLYNIVAGWTGGLELDLQPGDGVPREEYR